MPKKKEDKKKSKKTTSSRNPFLAKGKRVTSPRKPRKKS